MRTTVYLSEDLRRRLAAAAESADRPQAEIVRDALDDYLTRTNHPKLTFVGSAGGLGVPAREAKAWVRAEWARAAGADDHA